MIMFCCTFIGLFLTQLAAVAGIVKVDRSNGMLLRVRESISRKGLLTIVFAGLATVALSGVLVFDISDGKNAFVASSQRHLCSIIGLALPLSQR